MKYVEAPDFFLFTPAVATDTSITINNLIDIYGNVLTMTDFGDVGYGRINPEGTEISESFSFTGVTANSDDTYTLTGVKTVLAKSPYTQTSGLVRSHSINARVRFSNTAGFYSNFVDKDAAQTIAGDKEFTGTTTLADGSKLKTSAAPTADEDIANKKYIDDTAIAGGVKATTSVYGISKMSTAPASAIAPIAVGDNDTRIPTQDENDALAGNDGTPSTTNTFVTEDWLDNNTTATPTASSIPIADGSGKLDNDWLEDNVVYNTKSQATFTAGENITAGEGVIMYSTTDEAKEANYDGADNNAYTLTTTRWHAQTFLTSASATAITKVKLDTSVVGAPNGNLVVSIRATSAGAPTGADISSITSEVLATTIGEHFFVFDSPVPVSPATTYAIVLRRDNTSDIVRNDSTTAGAYADGAFYESTNSGSTWAYGSVGGAGEDMAFFEVWELSGTPGEVYLSDASSADVYANNFLGFADANITAAASGLINIGGIDDNQTGLTIGATYYLSDTSGAISSSVGSVTRAVGLATSATEILIKHENN